MDAYQQDLYVLPKNEHAGAELFQILSQQPKIKKVEWKNKFTDSFDYDRHGKKKLICVYPESVVYYKILLKSLEKDPRVAQLFNTDLSLVQQYLFTKLKIEPTNKVEVQYDKDESRLINLSKINEDDILTVVPPPFSILYFEIHTASPYNLGPDDFTSRVTEVRMRYQEEPEISLDGSEDIILKDFRRYVLTKDPDILVSTNQYSRNIVILEYLFTRMSELGLDQQLGRDNQTNKKNRVEGRVYLSNRSFHSDLDLVSLIEKAQFAFLPLGLGARSGMTRLIDSRNCYELFNRGFVIHRSNNHERIRSVEEIIAKDKGGMIFSPRVGLHENIAVLDYENEYANLILKHNLSLRIG